jgi:hypothetical protein
MRAKAGKTTIIMAAAAVPKNSVLMTLSIRPQRRRFFAVSFEDGASTCRPPDAYDFAHASARYKRWSNTPRCCCGH